MKVPVRLEIPGTRWIVDCPRELCGNAYRLQPGDPPSRLDIVDGKATWVEWRRRFKCGCTDDVVCLHEMPCGQIIEPVFPADIAAGLDVLKERPPENRGWLPGETVADLVAENLLHGVAVP